MPKRAVEDEEKPKKLSSYTLKLDDGQMEKVRSLLSGRGWESCDVAYARFAFKGRDCNVTGYESGKLVVAGKGTEEFVTMVLEPEVTMAARLGYDSVHHPEWFELHAGLDESGKGDLFGPVVAATVIADKAAVEAWLKAGVRDSKKIGDPQIEKLDKVIRETPGVAVETCLCGMPKYNLLMGRPGANLNRLLAWQHATALVRALGRRKAQRGLLDQFSTQPLVQRELKRMGVEGFDLQMRTKAEEDPVVAAASVVARAEYVRQIHALSGLFGGPLQKGAGPLVKAQAAQIVSRMGARSLGTFAKLHFRTAYEVVSEAGKLDELPLPVPREKMEWGGGRASRTSDAEA
ncbi:MAG TPA: ribonuclease HIII [Opitutaceae bacterium]|jgi:ribonuclease HIII